MSIKIVTFVAFAIHSIVRPSDPSKHLVLGLATVVLEREDTTLDGVEKDVAGLEVWVDRPGAEELNHAVNIIILRVAVEEADLLEVIASGVLGDTGDIDDAKTGAIVGLVGKTVDDLWRYVLVQD